MRNVNPSAVQRLLATDAGWAPLALRLPIGMIFVAHGAQKLFGAFGRLRSGRHRPVHGLARPDARLPDGLAGRQCGVLSAAWHCCSACWCGPPPRHWLSRWSLPSSRRMSARACSWPTAVMNSALALLAASVALLISGGGRLSVDTALAERAAR